MSEPPVVTGSELLDQAEDALHSIALSLIGVKPWLDKPYTDRPELTPWTHGIGQQARRAHDLGMAIRKNLGLPHRWRTTALGTPPLEAGDVTAPYAARIAALEAALTDVLGRFTRTDSGRTARVSGTVLARWQAIAGGQDGDVT